MRHLIAARTASFRYAFLGIATLFRTQVHVRIHAFATICVVTCGAFFRIALGEWIDLIFAMTIVWVAEGFNTALEFLADEITLEKRAGIGRAKDVAAAAVLIASIGAGIVGLILFVPHILNLPFFSR